MAAVVLSTGTMVLITVIGLAALTAIIALVVNFAGWMTSSPAAVSELKIGKETKQVVDVEQGLRNSAQKQKSSAGPANGVGADEDISSPDVATKDLFDKVLSAIPPAVSGAKAAEANISASEVVAGGKQEQGTTGDNANNGAVEEAVEEALEKMIVTTEATVIKDNFKKLPLASSPSDLKRQIHEEKSVPRDDVGVGIQPSIEVFMVTSQVRKSSRCYIFVDESEESQDQTSCWLYKDPNRGLDEKRDWDLVTSFLHDECYTGTVTDDKNITSASFSRRSHKKPYGWDKLRLLTPTKPKNANWSSVKAALFTTRWAKKRIHFIGTADAIYKGINTADSSITLEQMPSSLKPSFSAPPSDFDAGAGGHRYETPRKPEVEEVKNGDMHKSQEFTQESRTDIDVVEECTL